MPTWQGIEFLERVLNALAQQEIGLAWDFLAVDSGSSDGTWELLGRFAERFPVPMRRERIDKVEFDHGDTRNLLAAKSTGDLLVFLTQDAIPTSPRWLATLAKNFDDPRVGAAYCRNVPRPDADLLTRLFSAHDLGYTAGRRETHVPDAAAYARMNAHERRVLYNFNDVASAVRRELWERHPFPRTWFGEDVLMARALLEGGFTVVYDDAATVEHSHDYDDVETYERAKIDGRFNAEWLDRICVATSGDALALTERQLAVDRSALRAARLSDDEYGAERERAERLRAATFNGLHEGGLTKRRYARTRMLERTELSILYVVHGFPPDTWAGTEIYTFNLASEMQRRGHRVTILARVPAPSRASASSASSSASSPPSGFASSPGSNTGSNTGSNAGSNPAPNPVSNTGAEFSLEDTTFQGLRVLRLLHRLEHARLRDGYQNTAVERVFRSLLARERFDVVHFQHLIHLSAGLVHVARERGLATLITCHDYWSICARVQLIRPDGVRCEENMGSGCFLCVRNVGLKQITRLKKLDRVASPLLDAAAAGTRHGRVLPQAMRKRWEGFDDLRERHAYVTGAYKAADLRVSPSRFLRKKLVETAGFDPHTLVYSDNGMRTDHVRALEKKRDPQGTIRFGFVGSLVWYKGGLVMLEAMKRLGAATTPTSTGAQTSAAKGATSASGARAVLNVYGDFKPESDAHHAELARAAGPNVFFRGRFDNARLSEVYAEIDVLLVPSIWFENSPITIHEAFLTRTPVVASDIGGMREYVRDGIDGLWFKAGDARDLARVLQRFVDEPDLIEGLSRDFPPVKTIADDAAATEFRYRALCCIERVPLAGSLAGSMAALVEHRGIDSIAREGKVEVQGADMLLLRPGGAAAEYDIEGSGGGARVIEVEQLALAVEGHVRLGGRVLVDGREVGRLPAFSAEDRDELRRQRIEVDLHADARRLRFEPEPSSSALPTHLRLKKISVLAAARSRDTRQGAPA
jgi:glycosyltransferase involved in cell wall biosynthesis